MRLNLPIDFPTEVLVAEAPGEMLLPDPRSRWVLLGDESVKEFWTFAELPEPEGSLWIRTSEDAKRLDTLIPILEHWAAIPLHRDAVLVAVGGGVLTDMAGLAASLYLRGIHWHAWPTTLLAQVDAGLGGKTAVNLSAGKNLAGAFHAPSRLVACRSFLRTLPVRQLEAGRWEMVKIAVMAGDMPWAEAILNHDLPPAEFIQRTLAAKAEIVHRDPTEQGERRLLNLGHTLGHALEAASRFQLLHGEAVGLGLLAACFLAEELGLEPFPVPFLRRLAKALKPLAPLAASWEECRPWLLRDKKAAHGLSPWPELHCILPLPSERARQMALKADAWMIPHRRLLASLS
ncbi:MAG: 3-dehydroquinate synthase [Holophagaceae bacterium]|nr:3-dehydroquinate synthase [Holophagaceae bacterium]